MRNCREDRAKSSIVTLKKQRRADMRRVSRDKLMCEPSSFEIAKAFAAPAATVVASFVAVLVTAYFACVQAGISRGQLQIANAQSEIAAEKLKHDLFEKRYEIYLAAKAVIEHILNNAVSGRLDAQFIRNSLVKIDESRFFFENDIRVYLSSIECECQAYFELMAQRSTCNSDNHAKYAALADQLAEKDKILTDTLLGLPARFESALAFKQITLPKISQ